MLVGILIKSNMKKTFRVGSCYNINGQIYKMVERGNKRYEGIDTYFYYAKFHPINHNCMVENDAECVVGFYMDDFSSFGKEAIVLELYDSCNAFGSPFSKYIVYPDENLVKLNKKTGKYEKVNVEIK